VIIERAEHYLAAGDDDHDKAVPGGTTGPCASGRKRHKSNQNINFNRLLRAWARGFRHPFAKKC